MDHNLRGDICSATLACLGVSSRAGLVEVLLRIVAPLLSSRVIAGETQLHAMSLQQLAPCTSL